MGVTVFISLASFSSGILLSLYVSGLNPLFVFLTAPILSAWMGGLNQGLLSIGISYVLYLLYLKYTSVGSANINTFIQIILFTIEGFLISLAIHKVRRSDEVSKYKRKVREYERQIESLQKEKIHAADEIKIRDEFLSIASHELKTPLTLVLLQIQRALYNIRNVSLAKFSVENLLKMLEGVEQQTKRLARMISDLLNVSLITTGKFNLELGKTDLTAIVKDVSERIPQTLNKADYPLTLEVAESIFGRWDKVRIEQAVVNLVSNAIKYGNNKPVAITVKKSNGIARVAVKDNGIGIAEADKKKIFARFQRGVSSKDYQGLGVGLYITNQIICAHKGSIKVESRVGRGSTFIIELPIHKNP